MSIRSAVPVLVSLLAMWTASPAQSPEPRRYPAPDERMKADMLLIVAHPDDETAVGGLLAKAIFDDHKRVAIIYCNRGSGGGNSAGIEQSTSLGAIREIEGRRAAAAFGITNVWFLNGRDTPGQDVFQSLQAWQHGAILEDVVRLVRLTRAEIILSWLPHVVAGENHGDHQASGVIAVEAFDMAGDPTAFPAQVTPPRERTDINNATEGLRAWQPKKIYFFSDASRPVVADGPAFDIAAISPSRHKAYVELAAALHEPHRTQADVSQAVIDAERTGDFRLVKEYLEKFRLIYGKSVVPAAPKGDLFEGTGGQPAEFVRVPGYHPEARKGTTLELGGVFAFYRDFWRAHDIERIGPIVSPAIEVAAGSYLHIPLLIRNDTSDTLLVTLTPRLPDGWKAESGGGVYRVTPGEVCPLQTFIRCPQRVTEQGEDLIWNAATGDRAVGSARLNVRLVDWALPQ